MHSLGNMEAYKAYEMYESTDYAPASGFVALGR